MKFKYLLIAFSILILVILSILIASQIMIPDVFARLDLQYIVLPLIVLIFGVLVFLGIFLLLNYRLLSLLEREDWPALAYYLEQKIYVKNRYNNRLVQLLASSYMVISDYLSVLKLESKAALAKPSVIEKNVLIFGSARILSGKHNEAAVFFKTHLDKDRIKNKDKDWVRWFYAFSYLLGGEYSKVETEFLSLAANSQDAVITCLSAYFLANNLSKHSLRPSDCLATAEKGRERLKAALKNIRGWKREVNKMAADIHIAIIRKYVDEAGLWLFPENSLQPDVAQAALELEKTVSAEVKTKKEPAEAAASIKKSASIKQDDTHPIISDKQYNEEITNLNTSSMRDKREDTL